jgi:small-conductance mechanosensitive channel
MDDETNKNRKGNTFSIVLYIFSGLALALGAILLFLLLGAARAVTGYDIFFQLAGIAPLAQVILHPLQVGLINVGILVCIFMLAIAGLLFTAGRLIARQASLAERVRVLEEKFETLHTSHSDLKEEDK